jgi:hypothetical protein
MQCRLISWPYSSLNAGTLMQLCNMAFRTTMMNAITSVQTVVSISTYTLAVPIKKKVESMESPSI